MAPKEKKKGKGKKKGAPKPDSGWEKTLGNNKWERPLESLPDPALTPAFAETRTKVLEACKILSIIWNARLDEPFISELFGTPRPLLEKLELRGAKYLPRYIMSPYTVAPALKDLDLSCCAALEYVFIESNSLEKITFARCHKLKRAFIVVRGLKEVDFKECFELVDLMLWSDALTSLELPYREMDRLELYCPQLNKDFIRPPVKIVEPKVVPQPRIKDMLEQDRAVERYERNASRVMEPGFSGVLDAPRSPYFGFNTHLQAS